MPRSSTNVNTQAGTYTPTSDVTETLPDGTVKVIARAGVPIPIEQARRLGLLKDRGRAGPAEHKSAGSVVDGRFIPNRDILRTLPDGRQIQVALAGVPMSTDDARRAGLLPPLEAAPDIPGVLTPTSRVTLIGFPRAPHVGEMADTFRKGGNQ